MVIKYDLLKQDVQEDENNKTITTNKILKTLILEIFIIVI